MAKGVEEWGFLQVPMPTGARQEIEERSLTVLLSLGELGALALVSVAS